MFKQLFLSIVILSLLGCATIVPDPPSCDESIEYTKINKIGWETEIKENITPEDFFND